MLARPLRRPGRRRAARLLVAAGLALLAAVIPAGPAAHAQGGGDGAGTPGGRLVPGDRNLLVGIREAGLWQAPAAQQAAERGTGERVREVGGLIAQEHAELEQQLLEVAGQVGVAVPEQPPREQAAHLGELEALSGEQFDQRFVQLLREAYGAFYPVVAYARSGTENALVRELAKETEEFVNRHMGYLESTGLVDWQQIPPPPQAAGWPSRFLGTMPAGIDPVLIWLLAGATVIAGAVTFLRSFRTR